MTGSLDVLGTRYAAVANNQRQRQEVIDKAQEMALDLLQQYKTATKMVPQRIIYIRDGVSEGQYAEILNVELAAIREAAKAVTGPHKLAKITVIIAKKRHHTRFFPTVDVNSNNGNVSPGTVVDTGITHPVEFDFCTSRVASTDHSHRPAQSLPRDGSSSPLSYLVYLRH
jgi:eukaryotic translation initiation factor 2C